MRSKLIVRPELADPNNPETCQPRALESIQKQQSVSLQLRAFLDVHPVFAGFFESRSPRLGKHDSMPNPVETTRVALRGPPTEINTSRLISKKRRTFQIWKSRCVGRGATIFTCTLTCNSPDHNFTASFVHIYMNFSFIIAF